MKLAILTSHVIQYQTPLFRKLNKNKEIDVFVYFCWNFGVKYTYDKQFMRKIVWDIPLLDGYNYKFLKNYSFVPSSEFCGQINFGIIKELVKNKYDAILIYGWNSFTSWFAFFIAPFVKTKVILHSENPLSQELSKNKIKLFIKRVFFKLLFKRVSFFAYIGKENKKFYKHYGVPDKKLFFMPYAVDNDRFKKAYKELKPKRDDLRKELGIKKKDVVILFVGKLIHKKRPLDLLNAYKLLITDHSLPTTHLIFVGDGKLRSDLEEYVKKYKLKNIHFTGFKNQTELPEYYMMADIFVLPSGIGETWGLVTNEAMCFELPVVVSNIVGCSSDLVKNGENGYIFKYGNVEELSKYIQELIKGKNKIKEFGEKSFEIIQSYSHKKDVEAINANFES